MKHRRGLGSSQEPEVQDFAAARSERLELHVRDFSESRRPLHMGRAAVLAAQRYLTIDYGSLGAKAVTKH